MKSKRIELAMLEDCASNIIDVLEICYNFLARVQKETSGDEMALRNEMFVRGFRGVVENEMVMFSEEMVMNNILGLSVQAVHDAFTACRTTLRHKSQAGFMMEGGMVMMLTSSSVW